MPVQAKNNLVRAVPGFRDLDAASLRRLAAIGRIARFKTRAVILRPSDPVKTMFVVVSGYLKVVPNQPKLTTLLGPREVFGELLFLDRAATGATVSTLGACELFCIDRDRFRREIGRSPTLARALLRIQTARVLALTQAAELTQSPKTFDPEDRIAELAQRHGTRFEPSIYYVPIKLSPRDWADLTAVPRDQIDQQLRSWVKSGLVSNVEGGRSLVVDLSRMRSPPPLPRAYALELFDRDLAFDLVASDSEQPEPPSVSKDLGPLHSSVFGDLPDLGSDEPEWLKSERTLEVPASAPAREVASVTSEPKTADDGYVYRVWFGTNRKLIESGKPDCRFGGARARDTTLGTVDVWVPKAHRFGETGNHFLKRLWRGDIRDDHLSVRKITALEAASFWAALRQSLETAAQRGEGSDALVFIHGYNTTFEQAAIRAAQLGVDLQVQGVTAFFSWPSRARVAAYPADEATIEASTQAFETFLVDFTRLSGARRVHVIAHSMGNRGLLRALESVVANSNASSHPRVRFGQILLAAPDIDRDLFLQLAHVYSACSERTTLYASNADRAVHLSSRLHDAPRAGYFIPYTTATGIDSVAVPDFDVDLLGHGYYAQAAPLLHDIYDLLRHNDPPPRQRMSRMDDEHGAPLWQLSL